jgi:hypothetical protein
LLVGTWDQGRTARGGAGRCQIEHVRDIREPKLHGADGYVVVE